jgi:hypothetical protein
MLTDCERRKMLDVLAMVLKAIFNGDLTLTGGWPMWRVQVRQEEKI